MARSDENGPTTLGRLRAELLPRLATGVDRGLSGDGLVWKLDDALNGIEIEIESMPSHPDLWVVTTWPVEMLFEIESSAVWLRTWLSSAGREPLHITVLRVGRRVVTWDLAAPIDSSVPWYAAFARVPGVRLEVLAVRELGALGLRLS